MATRDASNSAYQHTAEYILTKKIYVLSDQLISIIASINEFFLIKQKIISKT